MYVPNNDKTLDAALVLCGDLINVTATQKRYTGGYGVHDQTNQLILYGWAEL